MAAAGTQRARPDLLRPKSQKWESVTERNASAVKGLISLYLHAEPARRCLAQTLAGKGFKLLVVSSCSTFLPFRSWLARTRTQENLLQQMDLDYVSIVPFLSCRLDS